MSLDILLVGCGNMGGVLLRGWLETRRVDPAHVVVVEPVDETRSRAAALGVGTVACADDVPKAFAPDLVVLAVKPQMMGAVLPLHARRTKHATLLSIAAGTPFRSIETALGRDAAIIRAVPNMPASARAGVTVLCANGRVDEQRSAFVRSLFEAVGIVHIVSDEGLLDAVTAISGSGPAYVFYAIECLAAAGAAIGLAPDLALDLAIETFRDAGLVAADRSASPAERRQQVTSPRGTTAAALEVLMGRPGLSDLMARAVTAAFRRSKELGTLF